MPLPIPCRKRRQNRIISVRNTFSNVKSTTRIPRPINSMMRRPYLSIITPVGNRKISAEMPRTPTIAPDSAVDPPNDSTYRGNVPICVVMAVDASAAITISRMKSRAHSRSLSPLHAHVTCVAVLSLASVITASLCLHPFAVHLPGMPVNVHANQQCPATPGNAGTPKGRRCRNSQENRRFVHASDGRTLRRVCRLPPLRRPP